MKENQTEKTDLLFDVPADWQKEWEGMPEFVQEKQSEFSKIIIRFENEHDLQSFAKLIGQRLTSRTKSIWYPFKSHWGQNPNMKWHDES
jgi:hypothetical protein